MDDQLFVQYAGIHTIGITGTRGKTTTTHLIYELLSRLGHRQVLLGGNIQGIATLPLIKHIRSPETIAVLELSSWQLQGFASVKLSPNLAVFTNLYPDHLNTYTSLTSYYRDKQNLTRFQSSSDYVFFNQAQRGLFQLWADQTQAQAHWYSHKDLPQHLTLKLLGQHNRENAAAAYAVARHYQLPNQETLHILSDFSGLPYRLQLIKSYQGIDIYNDSTSTTPTATIKALQSFDCPIILILGGTDKNLPVSDLIATVNAKADHLILIEGNGTDRIKHSLNSQKILLTTDSLHQAVSTALDIAKKGDVILFSPGFTSFGLFNNEYDRGEKFNQALRQIL